MRVRPDLQDRSMPARNLRLLPLALAIGLAAALPAASA
jgi:hypothetical protein